MVSDLLPLFVFATIVWWSSTGVVLWLTRRPARAFPRIALAAVLVGLAATLATLGAREVGGAAGAYIGFSLGLAIWGAHEVLFLLGFVSGSRKTPCPPGLSTFSRFLASTEAIIHHELLLAGHALALFALSAGAANQAAAMTFALLWVMRLSSKLIVFFGAPNISEEFLPRHLAYLGTYFSKRQNPACALPSLAFVLCLTLGFGASALGVASGGFDWTIRALLACLAGLALFEHVALIAPVPDAALWAWAAREPKSPFTQETSQSPAGGNQ